MEILTPSKLEVYVHAVKKILEKKVTDSNTKVSAIIDFADPMNPVEYIMKQLVILQ